MLKRILYALAILLLVGLVAAIIEYVTFASARRRSMNDQVVATTSEMRDQVDEILQRIVMEGDRLAKLFGDREFSRDEVEQIIRQSSLDVLEIQGVTAAYEPFAFAEDERLFCPYYNKGTQEFLYVGKEYDYTDTEDKAGDWYTSVRDNGAKWVEPYYAKGAKDWYVDYGVPFYFGDGPKSGQVRGTITLSFVCSGLKQLVHSLSLGKTGYGMISSQKGTLLAHPIDEFVGSKNLRDVKSESNAAAMQQALQGMLDGEVGRVDFYDADLKDRRLFCYDRIPTAGWGFGLMFFEGDLLGNQRAVNRRNIRLAILLSLIAVCLLAVYYNKDYLDEGEIWRLSLVSSVLLMVNITFIGYLRHHAGRTAENHFSPAITDMSALSSVVNQRVVRANRLHTQPPIVVPTGVFLQRMDFADSYNLNVSGTVWQKYPLGVEEDVNIGFQFPQLSPFAESSFVEESYREKIEGKEDEPGYLLVGWNFRVTLRQNFRYADFPFDKRQIDIRLASLDPSDHLLFVPDLASYTYTNPSKKCGLSDTIDMSGSQIVETYFNFSNEDYKADFGYGVKGRFAEVPILHFNVQLRRLLLNAFVTYLIPIVVTLIMMFLLIYACRKTTERQGIIESMAAFCFVLIFSHIDLRREIVTADLAYIEYFYIITYIMVIASTFNLITYTLNKSNIFDFNDNQVFKAMFFPVFFMAVLAVTLVRFY